MSEALTVLYGRGVDSRSVTKDERKVFEEVSMMMEDHFTPSTYYASVKLSDGTYTDAYIRDMGGHYGWEVYDPDSGGGGGTVRSLREAVQKIHDWCTRNGGTIECLK